MKVSRTTRIVAAGMIALGLAAATPSVAFAKNAKDDPTSHNLNDVRGGHRADDAQPHA